MEAKIVVMIVTLAMPNGENSVNVKRMPSEDACKAAARIEASDPFVAKVECSELSDGKLELNFKSPAKARKIPEAVVERSTG